MDSGANSTTAIAASSSTRRELRAVVDGHDDFSMMNEGNTTTCPTCVENNSRRELCSDERTRLAEVQEETSTTASKMAISNGNCATEAILRQFPNNRSVWTKLIDDHRQSGGCDLAYFCTVYAGREIRADRDLMLKACIAEAAVLEHCVADQLRNQDQLFLEELLSHNPRALAYVSHEAQRLFPELLQRTFAAFFLAANNDYWIKQQLARNIRPEFWTDRDFVMTWFQAGGPFLDVHSQLWRDDREIFLLIAQQQDRQGALNSFGFASASLRGDKTFFLEVVGRNERLLLKASPELQQDSELLLLALSKSCDFVENYLTHGEGSKSEKKDRTQKLLLDVRDQLRIHDKFVQTILCGMSREDCCCLGSLNQGIDTALFYKKQFAAYLNVPTGKRLRILRQASMNASGHFLSP